MVQRLSRSSLSRMSSSFQTSYCNQRKLCLVSFRISGCRVLALVWFSPKNISGQVLLFCEVLRLGNSVHTINQVESRRAHNQLSEYGRLRAISEGSFRTLIPIITLFQETMTRRRPKWSVTFMYSTARSTAALPRTEINASSCRTRTWRNLGNRWKGRPQFDCRTFFLWLWPAYSIFV